MVKMIGKTQKATTDAIKIVAKSEEDRQIATNPTTTVVANSIEANVYRRMGGAGAPSAAAPGSHPQLEQRTRSPSTVSKQLGQVHMNGSYDSHKVDYEARNYSAVSPRLPPFSLLSPFSTSFRNSIACGSAF